MSSLPTHGFLGTGATFSADINLVIQCAMAAALVAGAILARKKRYKAHGICQTTVLLLNLAMIALEMWPSFEHQVVPHLSRAFHRWYYTIAAIHAVLGTTAEILGLYIIFVAGTTLIPSWLRFTHWKRWMRAEFALWLIVLVSGIGTYYWWYIAPFR